MPSGEFELIEALSKIVPLSKRAVEGIGDDTAVLPFKGGRYQLFTTDMLARGVHFDRKADPRMIGRKALACNISDIAAMGGKPTDAVVSIGVPRQCPADYVKKIYQGMGELARRFDVGIVGGDTISSPELIINVALLGEVRKKHLVLRSGARAGDWIWVTGPLGRAWKTERHFTFMPRVAEAEFLVEHFKPSAMMDISDGLAGDLGHILKAAGVGAELIEAQIPLNPGAAVKDALYDGEDFELLFTLSPSKSRALMRRQGSKRRWFFYPVGSIAQSRGLTMVRSNGQSVQLTLKGYTHF